MTDLYNPTLLRANTRATAEAVNAEHLKIQAALAELQAAVTALATGTVVTQPLYTWRAYANNATGTIDFSTTDPSGRSYIGLSFNRLVPTFSENPSDYEWSLLNGALGNFIAFDTTNVAGRPSFTLVDDINLFSAQLLAYQFDRQTLTDYVNARLFVNGVAVNAVIVQEQNLRIAGDTALAETISLIGAKNLAGSAFIVDMSKTFVDPTTSFAAKLSNMVAATGTVSATVQALQQVVTGLDFATATDLALLGAKNGDGTAFVMNLGTVKVSPTQTFSQYIDSTVAAAAGGAASVTQIFEAVITPTGGANAKAVLQLDVNGRLASIVSTNNGAISQFRAAFDKFVLEDTAGNPLFTAADGVVKMPNVEVDTLKVNSVTTVAIAPNAVTEATHTTLMADVAFVQNVETKALVVNVPNVQVGELLKIVGAISMYSVNDLTGQVIVKHIPPGQAERAIRVMPTKLDSDTTTDTYLTLPVVARHLATVAGTHQFSIWYRPTVSWAQRMVAGSDLEVTRQKA